MQNTTEQRRALGTRPGMNALRFMGGLELFVSVVLLLFGVPIIALFFAAASIFMAVIAHVINNRGQWYDRQNGMWRQVEEPPQPLRLPAWNALTIGLAGVTVALMVAALVLLFTPVPTITSLVMVLWAAALTLQLLRN